MTCRSTLLLLPLLAAFALGATAQDKVPNPSYQQWAKFKPGSWVKHRQVSEQEGSKTEVDLTSTLISVTAESVTIETRAQVISDGQPEAPMEPTRTEHPAAIDNPRGAVVNPEGVQLPAPKEGTEELKINGKTYPTRTSEYTTRVERETLWNKTWTCDTVPGGIVKTESRLRGGAPSGMTMILLEFSVK